MNPENKLSLYYYDSCPFCRMVNQEIKKLSLDVEKRNIQQDRQHFQNLVAGGGSRTVPCLLIEKPDGSSQWMYESRDIVAYLNA